MDKKIKILHVIGALRIGGAENIAMNFSRYIDKNRFQCDYLVFGKEIGEYESEAIQIGSKVIHIEPPHRGYLKYAKNLKNVLEKGNYDIVHSHTLLNNGLTLKIAHHAKIKKRISHSHSTNSGKKETLLYKAYSSIMKKNIKTYATEYIACGLDAGEYLYGESLFKSKGVIINNGIDLAAYSYNEKKREKKRDEFGVKKDLVIGHVGRFSKVKNHIFLLDVFKNINNINQDTTLILVGDGELRNEIEIRIKELGLKDNVILTGNRDDVSDIMQAMDVLIFPSLYEGLPVVLIEAQAAGLPCLISSNITQQVRITDLVVFNSLQETPQQWANDALNQLKIDRTNRDGEIRSQRFDAESIIQELEYIYVKP